LIERLTPSRDGAKEQIDPAHLKLGGIITIAGGRVR